jgi:hypothetical protein
MELHRKSTADGSALDTRLDRLLQELDREYPGAAALFVHMRDLHDGAARLEQSIADLAACDPADRKRINRLLWDMRVELYDHLIPNHVQEMRLGLEKLSSRLSNHTHKGEDEPD